MMHMLCMTKSPTYGVMISVPALLPAQNVHLATKRGHPRSVPVNRSKWLVKCIVWDYLRSAMQATNSQTFLATSYLRKIDGFILKWSLPLDFVGVLSASVPSANLKENSAYQEFPARFSPPTT